MYKLCMPRRSAIFTLQGITLPYLHRTKCAQDFTTMHKNVAQIVFFTSTGIHRFERDNESLKRNFRIVFLCHRAVTSHAK